MEGIYLTLHKLPEGFIVTSDEQAKEGELGYIPFQGGEVKIVGKYFADDCKRVIAQQDQIDFSALSEEEQKKISWFDVEEWVKQTTSSLKDDMMLKTSQMCLKAGFQKSQELLSDRRFTLEDIVYFAQNLTSTPSYISKETAETMVNAIISQPKSWNIEIETECSVCGLTGVHKMSCKTLSLRTQQPKFTNSKVKITKLL